MLFKEDLVFDVEEQSLLKNVPPYLFEVVSIDAVCPEAFCGPPVYINLHVVAEKSVVYEPGAKPVFRLS